jgi:hypothetical protein
MSLARMVMRMRNAPEVVLLSVEALVCARYPRQGSGPGRLNEVMEEREPLLEPDTPGWRMPIESGGAQMATG